MRTRNPHGGRHELGQNFLVHTPSITRVVGLVARTEGALLEIGAGDGALTSRLARLGRQVTALDIDPRRIEVLRRRHPAVRAVVADVMRHPLDSPVVVGNIPFHLTTPILRRLLDRPTWTDAILLTQWEVARKRAGVGGSTLMTAQTAPWFEFTLHGRVPAHAFRPVPNVDGGILGITRRGSPLVPTAQRAHYRRFVQAVFSGRGRGIGAILRGVSGSRVGEIRTVLTRAAIPAAALPRDLRPEQWAALWSGLADRG